MCPRRRGQYTRDGKFRNLLHGWISVLIVQHHWNLGIKITAGQIGGRRDPAKTRSDISCACPETVALSYRTSALLQKLAHSCPCRGNGLEAAYLATKSNIRCTSDAAFPEIVEIKCIATGVQVIAVRLLETSGPSCRTIHFTGLSNAVSGILMVIASYHNPSKRPAAVCVQCAVCLGSRCPR